MILQEKFVRRRGTYEMVSEWAHFFYQTHEALCDLALYLARGWRLKVYQRLHSFSESTVDIVFVDERVEQRIRFSTKEFDLKVFRGMARHAASAKTEKAKFEGIKRDLLRFCGIEEWGNDLARKLSVQDLVPAVFYYVCHRDEKPMDFAEAYQRHQAELQTRAQ